MVVILILFMGLSVAGNLVLLAKLSAAKKDKRKVIKPRGRNGLLGAEHTLVRLFMDDIRDGGRAWFYECSCGSELSSTSSNNEAYALSLWKKHVDLFKEFTEEGEEIKRLTEKLETFKKNCICHNL